MTFILRIFSVFVLALCIAGLPRAAEAQPAFSKVFSPNEIGPGGTSTLIFTIDNSDFSTPVTDLAFTDTLPAAMTISPAPDASTTCTGGTLTAPASGTTISYTGGAVEGFAICTISVNVTSSTPGTHTNVSGNLSSSAGNSGTATDDLTVTTSVPGFTKSFAPASIPLGGRSTLTYTIDNSLNASGVFNLDFDHTLPGGAAVASPANAATTCGGGVISAPVGGSAISYGPAVFGDATLAAGATCTVRVDVTGTGVGLFNSVTGDLTSIPASGFFSESSGAASATLEVTGGTQLQITKSFTDDPVAPGGTATLEFNIQNLDRSNAATDLAFTDDLNAMLAGASVDDILFNDCGGFPGDPGAFEFFLSSGTLAAGGSCTIRITVAVPSGASDGGYPNTTSDITGTIGGAGVTGSPASDTLFVQGAIPALTKTFTTASITAGDPVTMEFTITNPSGTETLTDLSFTDDVSGFLSGALPTALPASGFCGAGSSAFNSGFSGEFVLNITGASLAAGASCTFQVSFSTPADTAGGIYSNTTSQISGTAGGAPVVGPAASDSLTVNGGTALDFSKSFTDDPVAAGATATLVFTLDNSEGVAAVTGAAFSDDLDAMLSGAQAVSESISGCSTVSPGAIPASTYSISNATVPAGGVCTLTVGVAIPAGAATGDYVNTSSALSADGGVSAAPASDTLSVLGADDQPVILSKSFLENPYLPGQTGTLEFTIENPNVTSAASDIFFTDNLNAALSGLASISGTLTDICGAGSQIAGTTSLTFTGGSLAAGESCSFSVTVQVPGGAATGSYGNTTSAPTATVNGAGTSGDPASATLEVISNPATLTHTVLTPAIAPGGTGQAQIVLTNTAPGGVTNGAFDIDYGAVIPGARASLASLSGCSAGGGITEGSTLSASGFDFATSCTFVLNVTIPGAATEAVYDIATSNFTGDIGAFSFNAPGDSASYNVTSALPPSFSKAFSAASANVGESVTLTFTIDNSDAEALSNLQFTDDLDAFLSGAVATNTPVAACGGTLSGSSLLTFTGGTVAGMTSCAIPVTIAIPSTATGGSYTNTSSALFLDGLSLAPAASDGLTVNELADLSVTLTDSPDPTGPTDTLTYTVELSNAGPSAAIAPVSTLSLPAGVTLVATSGCSEDPNGVPACSLGDIAPGASTTYTAVVTVDAATTGTLNAQADVSSMTADPVPGNNSDTASTTVVPRADISLTKTDGISSIRAGATLSYAIVVSNAGPSTDPAVAVSDVFPASLSCSYVSTAAGGASGNSASGSGDIADTLAMPSGSSVSYTADCLVAADASGTLTNTATATASIADPVPGNNSATDGDTTVIVPQLGFTKTFTPDAVNQGNVTTLEFVIDNLENALPADNLAFTDDFPAGMEVADPANVSNGCGGSFAAVPGETSISLTGGFLAVEDSCTISVDLRATEGGALLNTTSELTSTLPTAAPASDTLNVNPAGAPNLSKSFAPQTVEQGEISRLAFFIDNVASEIEAENLAFTDDFPAGMEVADPANVLNSCGGSLIAVPGETGISLSGGVAFPGEGCTVELDVRATGAGVLTNTSSELTSTLPTALPATADLTVTPAAAPVFSKAFTPAAIDQGQISRMRFTIDNSANAIEAEDLAFTDSFPAGMVVASPAGLSNDCDGDITAAEGGASFTLADGEVDAGEICTIEIDVRALAGGDLVNTTSALSSTLPQAAAASATLSVTAAGVPVFAKAFAPEVIAQGEISTLTFTIDNGPNDIEAADLAFTDTLPDGLVVAPAAAVSNGCGGAVTATPGEAEIALSGGLVAEGALCTITVDVQGLTAGAKTNVTGVLSSSLGDAPGAEATLTVTAFPLVVTMSFAPATIEQLETAELIYTLTNNAAIAATGITLGDVLPDGVNVAVPDGAGSTCADGALPAIDGATEVDYIGGTLAPMSSCTITVVVSSAIAGSYPNTLESLTSSLGSSAPASATLTVEEASTGSLIIVQNTDTDGDYIFSSETPALNFTISTSGGLGRAGPIQVAAGTHVIQQSTPDGVGNIAITCNDNDSQGVPRERVLTVNISQLETVTCVFTSISSRQRTIDTINRFLTKRADLILSSEPGNMRRLNRLRGGFGGASPLSFANGDLNSFLPFTAQISTASDSYRISTSFLQMRQAAASLALAHGDTRGVRYIENYRWDAWFEAQYKKFDASDDSGHFAIAYFGADYLVTPDLLVGALLQVDDMEDDNATLGSSVSGTGWMAGPYVTARIGPNLYFDGRLAAGTSENDISPFNTYTDTFTTDRWMAMAGIIGEFQRGNWTIQPGASLSYFEEKQHAYVDSVGVAIPGQVVSLGQIKIGPTFTGQFEMRDGTQYTPFVSLDAIYNFGDTKGVTVSNPNEAVSDGWRGRVQAGVDFRMKDGMSLSLGGSYDGIGRGSLDIWGLSLELHIPFEKARAQ